MHSGDKKGRRNIFVVRLTLIKSAHLESLSTDTFTFVFKFFFLTAAAKGPGGGT